MGPLFFGNLTAMLLAALLVTYQTVRIEGWTAKVETDLIQDKHEWPLVEKELDRQLYAISRVVPDEPLSKLRQVTLWLHVDDKGTACAAFHPGAQWLRDHGMNPDMALGVEIGNAKNFVSWTYEQPWMVLHELSHAYHFRFLPQAENNPDIKAAYDNAMKNHLYDKVLHWSGSTEKHYATTNPMEFFAEASEAYFGQNDFYPFVNAELKTYDPTTYAMLVKVWGLPQKRG